MLINYFPVAVVWVSVACLALVPLLVQDIVLFVLTCAVLVDSWSVLSCLAQICAIICFASCHECPFGMIEII
jgi:hypothetical protein